MKNKILVKQVLYWSATLVMFYFMLYAAINYHIKHEVMASFFKQFGYPEYIVYPLAYLKVTALLVILINRYNNLKEMAYGAYFINTLMSTTAHLKAGHQPTHAYVLIIAIMFSYWLSNQVRGKPKKDFLIVSS
ncbi:DoxX family protein [Kangiella sp. HZ709]|uniref:DoxX family protein n=1 Tax=Kangiella sp. HZ709 TaxID=2666328 RepID=UPI0012AEF9EB|nr:DoxX family protein [Kangiella sp. HZ709]MRX28337.1 hypothetical protein [Kangiella sp. HZ709]